jgi:hypothetical protein
MQKVIAAGEAGATAENGLGQEKVITADAGLSRAGQEVKGNPCQLSNTKKCWKCWMKKLRRNNHSIKFSQWN